MAAAMVVPVALAGCNDGEPPEGPGAENPPPIEENTVATPVIRLKSGNILKWTAVANAESYSVHYVYDGHDYLISEKQTELTYTINHENVGEYSYYIIAINDTLNLVSEKSNIVKYKMTAPALARPVLTFSGDSLTWAVVPNAESYTVKDHMGKTTTQTACTYDISVDKPTAAGTYYYSVTATTTNPNYDDSVTSVAAYTVDDPALAAPSTQLINSTVYVVGDSTVSEFKDAYYLPRYGYGTQIEKYLDLGAGASVNNLALSGRSSYSFLSESNYSTLKTSIKAGDYLIIGFGHNDQKNEEDRYSNPNLSHTDTTKFNGRDASFQKILYDNYVKLAQDKGATPVLCTPIVRLSNTDDYSGANGHKTKDAVTSKGLACAGGDYTKAIKDLGSAVNVPVIDLTEITKADYTALGYDIAGDYHAWTGTKSGTRVGVDGTHTNMFGAMTNAYYIARELKILGTDLGAYVKADIKRPTYAADYEAAINTGYNEPEYSSFKPADKSPKWNITKTGWYGTAFGDLGGNNVSPFTVKQNADETFTVGTSQTKGKIGSTEGIATAFYQMDCELNFKISVEVTLGTYTGDSQTGFGLMLRDDIYIDEIDTTILSNYVAAGAYCTSSATNVLYSREDANLATTGNKSTFTQGSTHTLSIERVNQNVKVTFDSYSHTYYDFDFVAIDNDYMYICLYATRGTLATFKITEFEITGEAVAA